MLIDVRTYKCKPGYRLVDVNMTTMSCSLGPQLSTGRPECEPIPCGRFTDLAYSQPATTVVK